MQEPRPNVKTGANSETYSSSSSSREDAENILLQEYQRLVLRNNTMADLLAGAEGLVEHFPSTINASGLKQAKAAMNAARNALNEYSARPEVNACLKAKGIDPIFPDLSKLSELLK